MRRMTDEGLMVGIKHVKVALDALSRRTSSPCFAGTFS